MSYLSRVSRSEVVARIVPDRSLRSNDRRECVLGGLGRTFIASFKFSQHHRITNNDIDRLARRRVLR
jgi:hypothetical protein